VGWWLTPVILATQEAEIRRITVRTQLGQQFTRPYLGKKTCHTQKRAGGVAQGVCPEFKPPYREFSGRGGSPLQQVAPESHELLARIWGRDCDLPEGSPSPLPIMLAPPDCPPARPSFPSRVTLELCNDHGMALLFQLASMASALA
jgi:hypothetical protein